MSNQIYKNSAKLMDLNSYPIYMEDMVNACLIGRLNLFLQGDTGSGKTQLAKDAMNYFGTGMGDGKFASQLQDRYSDKIGNPTNTAINATTSFPQDRSLFILGRNDMDTRELFQQINLGKLNTKPNYNLEPLVNPDTGEVEYYYPKVDEKGIFIYQKLTRDQADIVRSRLEQLAGSTENIRELTSKINTNLIVVDELPNCVPAVRAQLFNLFDGFIEINGKAYPIGDGYSLGIATGNIGQEFTESSNDLGRALKDRMHVTVDVDHFTPEPSDTMEILSNNTNPRVEFSGDHEDKTADILSKYSAVSQQEIPFEKLIVANYLIHGLDYCDRGSKRKMKHLWPNNLESHEQGSDEILIRPVSIRAAKSIVRLSQALDEVAKNKGADKFDYFESMMQAFKFISAYSGVLNEAQVDKNYDSDKYKAMDAVITFTKSQFEQNKYNVANGLEMVQKGKLNQKVLKLFDKRWGFMKNTLEGLLNKKE